MPLKKWDGGFSAGSCNVLIHYSKKVYYEPQWTLNFNDKRPKEEQGEVENPLQFITNNITWSGDVTPLGTLFTTEINENI
jgi:hypothetical protein